MDQLFRARLRSSVEEGVLLGVKYGIVIAALGLVLYLLAGDYGMVRGRAYNGQLAFEALLKMQQEQAGTQAAPAALVPPVKPETTKQP